MALPGQEFEIELDGASIRYRKWTAGNTEQWSYFPVVNIHSVIPTEIDGFGTRQADNNRKNTTRLTDKLNIQINFIDDETTPLSFDIQNVMNQAGWTPNSAGLTQALDDINDWISSASSSSASTDALIQELVDQNSGSSNTGAIDLVSADFPYSLPAGMYSAIALNIVSGTISVNGSANPLSAGFPFAISLNDNSTIDLFTIDEVNPAVVTIYTVQRNP